MLPVIIGIVVVIVIACAIAGIYNNMVTKRNRIDNAWQNIDTQLQRRNDLIPNLVNTVKGYAAHESDVFKAVSDARAKLGGAKTVAETSQANGELSSALSRLLMIAENYPDLKANTNFLQLQDELAGTENRIAVARMDYNGAVQGFNAKIKSFPTVLYAGMFGFDARDYFKADESAKTVPQVQF
jgi:LemA protein